MKILPIPGKELELWNRTLYFQLSRCSVEPLGNIGFLYRLITLPVKTQFNIKAPLRVQLAFSQGETPRANITCLKYKKYNDVAVSQVFSAYFL
ncbi:MAG: hypothetical protein EA343_02695 [Nodularia sp. (in: Bacteria)]|nr:MAG: hypothetical protein EA343_02695 [Nodularia sp. (in: cyanobacteria)]